MKTTLLQKLFSALLALCLTLSLGLGAVAETAATAPNVSDFEALYPLMDLVAAASRYAGEAMGIEAESVPGAEGTLSVAFTDSLFKVGQAMGASLGITEAMLTDISAQAAFLQSVFAAQLPELEPVTVTEISSLYIGFHPVTAAETAEGGLMITGELYGAEKPMSQMSETDYPNIQWLDRGVFSFSRDANAFGGFRITGFSVGTELDAEEAIQNYFDEIVVEYVNANLGFSILYPAIFEDEMLVEDTDGVSAELADESVSFFAKRVDNVNGATLQEYVSIVSDGITGSVSTINDELRCGKVTYTTEDGYAVYDMYIVTEQHVYQAELRCKVELMGDYAMYASYMENSFAANDVSVG